MTKTAVFSDIHGNLPALTAVAADAGARGCTRFLDLGDIVSGPLWPGETADFLLARGHRRSPATMERQLRALSTERMNASDRFAQSATSPAHRAWLRALPATLALDDMLLCHGTPASDLEPLAGTIAPKGMRGATAAEVAQRIGGAVPALLLCGHTHVPQLVTLASNQRVLNPGSVGLQAYVDDDRSPHRAGAGDPRAIRGDRRHCDHALRSRL